MRTFVRRLLAVAALLAVIASLTLPTTAAGAATAPAHSRYRDAQDRFTFEVPITWEELRTPSLTGAAAVRYRSDAPYGTFNVVVESLPPGISTLDRYVEEGTAQLRRVVPGLAPAPDNPRALTLGGEPAEAVRYTATLAGLPVVVEQVAAIRDGQGYVLTFIALESDADAFFREAEIVRTSWQFV